MPHIAYPMKIFRAIIKSLQKKSSIAIKIITIITNTINSPQGMPNIKGVEYFTVITKYAMAQSIEKRINPLMPSR